jgi:hypothetical protein
MRALSAPRIIFACPRLPHPTDNGWNQRMFHTLEALAALGETELVCYGSPRSAPDLGPLAGMCRQVHVIPEPEPYATMGPAGRLDFVQRLVSSPTPLLVSQFQGKPLADAVTRLATRADLIWAVRLFVAEAIRTGRERMIVDLDDVESVREARRLAVLPAGTSRLLCWLDNLKLRRFERGTPDRYARIAIASEHDRRLFHKRMADKILVVPNGVSARLLDEPRTERPGPTLLFVANMRYGANVDAAFWFAREIFPRIRSRVTEARLWLVGHDDQGHVRELHDGDSIIVTGRVDDVVPFVTRATVSVVPLRWGGGTRIKILESLALGTPVVSTTIGADGLDLVPGRDIVIADTPESFAESVSTLLGDRPHREALAAAGRRVVAARYTWEKIIGDLRTSVLEWLACPAGSGGIPLSLRRTA